MNRNNKVSVWETAIQTVIDFACFMIYATCEVLSGMFKLVAYIFR